MSSEKGGARTTPRQHDRQVIQLPIVLGDASDGVRCQVQFDTRDLSAGGAFIRSDLLFEVGEELRLALALPDGRSVAARGKVVRVSREASAEETWGMGIMFLDLASDDRAAIETTVIRGGHG